MDAVFLIGSLIIGAFIIPCNNELQKILSLTDVTCHKTQLHTKNFVILPECLCTGSTHFSVTYLVVDNAVRYIYLSGDINLTS